MSYSYEYVPQTRGNHTMFKSRTYDSPGVATISGHAAAPAAAAAAAAAAVIDNEKIVNIAESISWKVMV